MTEDELTECFTGLLGLFEVKEDENPEADFFKTDSMCTYYCCHTI